MTHQVIEPQTKEELANYYFLRWQLLRQPWDQPLGSEQDLDESHAIHAMVTDKRGHVVGVGRLHQVDEQTGQIRYMAVTEAHRGLGIGTAILTYLENRARALHLSKLVLNARDTSLPFYLRQGYRVVARGHTLYNSIHHQILNKSL